MKLLNQSNQSDQSNRSNELNRLNQLDESKLLEILVRLLRAPLGDWRHSSRSDGLTAAVGLQPTAGAYPWAKAARPPSFAAPRRESHAWRNVLPRAFCLGLAAARLCRAEPAAACGPDFPNNLLDQGDTAVLAAPVANFAAELDRMNLVTSKFKATATESTDAEMADLSAALKKSQLPQDEIEKICRAQAATREALTHYSAATQSWQNSRNWVWDEKGRHLGDPETERPKFPKIAPLSGLPGEFSDYLEAAVVWHDAIVPDKTVARQYWERLLARPAGERHFKSTWAAFMLGKSWEEEDPDKAAQYFQQVRDLARQGFADSAGLAAASLGLEARICLHQEKFERAVELYLEQWATGDSSAVASLKFAGYAALHASDEALQTLAKNIHAQRVITAYLVAKHSGDSFSPSTESTIAAGDGAEDSSRQNGAEDSANDRTGALSPASRWLGAVEAAGVKDVESAEKLALAAYQNNEMDLAQRWIKRAPGSPVSQWLQAKLFLRSGKVQAAAALMARVAPGFPVEPHGTNEIVPTAFKDDLFMRAESFYPDIVPVTRQVLGELGVLRLARREYTEALDALLRAGFWMDAAYVAERVLTTDELKAYVDAYWPPVSAGQIADEKDGYVDQAEVCPATLREKIRYLLARRLTRVIRGNEARLYYPETWVPQFDALAQALTTGWDEALPASQRAQALVQAAFITRSNGMELIGTEVEPDWHIHNGVYEDGVTAGWRATNAEAKILVASKDELDRAAQNHADPEARFHYRYQAAFLGWEAAKLMPNNTDETARVLWTAGCWLKNRDPQTADLFYKALVRRNRHTALGAEADRRRWFPDLDENGNVVPMDRESKPSEQQPEPTPAQEQLSEDGNTAINPPAEDSANAGDAGSTPYIELKTASGELVYLAPAGEGAYSFVVRRGDSLASIARILAELGIPVTPQDIIAANPGLEAGRLLVGQKLLFAQPGRSP